MYNNQIPDEYKPLGMWAYFGYTLLFSLPIAGFICILVFSFGGTSNINLRNFARSYFCWFLIALAVGIIVGFIAIMIALLSSAGLSSLFSGMNAFDFLFGVLPCAL